MTPLCTRICPYPFFEATHLGAAPGPPVKTGARVRRFRGCNYGGAKKAAFRQQHQKTCGGGRWRHDGKPQLVHERHLGVVPPGPNPTPRDTSGTPRTYKGMVSAYTQALRDRDLPEEDIRVLNKIIPDFLFDLRGADEAFEDM